MFGLLGYYKKIFTARCFNLSIYSIFTKHAINGWNAKVMLWISLIKLHNNFEEELLARQEAFDNLVLAFGTLFLKSPTCQICWPYSCKNGDIIFPISHLTIRWSRG